jgi:hypothetical protein
MTFTTVDMDYPKMRPASDGWTSEWRRWFNTPVEPARIPNRSQEIIRAVRAALQKLGTIERLVIQMYFYEGLSWSHIGDRLGLSVNRSRAVQRRALVLLQRQLAPFVRATFGLEAVREDNCPICTAPWRRLAEELLDAKTPDDTWGRIGLRIERATGWKTATPQILKSHQKYHRGFEPAQPREHSFEDLFIASEEEE